MFETMTIVQKAPNFEGLAGRKFVIHVYHVAYEANFVSCVRERRNFLPTRGISSTRR